MFHFSSETILTACNNLNNCPAQVGGIISIISVLSSTIEPLTTYTINNRKLKLKLSEVFDNNPKNDFQEAEAKYIVFSNDWETHFFDTIIKDKIDLLSIAIFFMRRKSFATKFSSHDVIEQFIKENHISPKLRDAWFIRKNDFPLEYNENNIEENQKKFYLARFKTDSFKSITFNSPIQKCAYEFSAAAHIQTLYSGNDIKKSFIYSDVSLSDYYNFQGGKHLTTNKETFPHNRIVFGAPGTGKSNLLKIKQDEYFPNTNQQSQVSEEEIIRKELANIGNSYSKSFSLGFQYHEFFKDKKPKFIRETYGCNAEAAYITSQGARCVDFFNSLPDYSDSEITKEKVKEQLKKAEEQNYMKEAGSAAVGRKYSNYLYGKSISEICQELELVETHTQSRFIWYGVQSVDYTFEKETSEIIKLSERVTFHPNYSYAQFVGTYKPVQDSNDDEKIKYEYVPGPFMRVYVNALKHTDRNFLLLIEEINRANVATVFGDVFQLLDRDENDNSEYPIAASEDIKKYLAKNGIHDDELKIPSNMYIWATMNSADQGVFPMDTAFKRRWEFEYIGINENEDKVKGYEIPISATKKVNWNELRKAINNKLITLGINEDKLLGPFFLSKTVLDSALDKGMDFVKLFESKVLMYLFEDAAKMKAKQLFNVDEKKFIYSEVCRKFEEIGVKVFKFNAEDVVEEHDISIKEDAALTDGKLF